MHANAYLVITRRAKGQISNAAGLRHVRSGGLCMAGCHGTKAAATRAASLEGHFGRGVHAESLLCTQPPRPPPRQLIMSSLVLTQLRGAPKFTGRRGGTGGSFPLLRSRGCVVFPSPPLVLPDSLSSVGPDKPSGGSNEDAPQSPSSSPSSPSQHHHCRRRRRHPRLSALACAD